MQSSRLHAAASVAVLLGFIPAGCKASRPVPRDARIDPVVPDTIRVGSVAKDTAVVASFKDSLVSSTTFADARTFELRRPGQRDALRATLGKERELWRAKRPRDYQFLLRVDCFCPGRRGWLLIEARMGQPLRAWDSAGKSAALSDWNTFSIDSLFDRIERGASMDGVVQVAFDQRWHFPATVRTIRLPGPDAWTIIDARGFRPLK